MTQPTQRWLLLAAIVVTLAVLQWQRDHARGPYGVDGSYYLQVARHVAAGDGLQTSVDLYHQGLRTLPTRTNIYPLWPLVLGAGARVLGLHVAATAVPRAFFILDLLLLYALANVIAERWLGTSTLWNAIDAGHVAVLLLGLNVHFFSATAYPYTEGLAFFAAFASLLLLDGAVARASASLMFACGLVASLAFLTRSQMLFLGAGIGVVLVVAATRRRLPWRLVALFLAAFCLPIAIWSAWLATFVEPFTLRALIAMHGETPGIAHYDQLVPVRGVLEYVGDRLGGLAVMFNPLSPLSFVASFGVAALLVPAAFVHYFLRKDREPLPVIASATLLGGALLCLALLQTHNRFFLEWLFGYRHGLTLILLLVFAVGELVIRGGVASRTLTIVAICLSLVTSAGRTVAFASEDARPWPTEAEAQLARWLATNNRDAIVLTTNAQELAVVSDANFRWAACDQPPESTLRLLTLVRTDYALVYETQQRCGFLRGLREHVQPVATFGRAPNRIALFRVVRR